MNSFRQDFAALVDRARAGDVGARELLISRCEARLLDRIRLMMGKQARAAAESGDFVQEVFLRLQQRTDPLAFEDEDHLVRWLSSVARNLVRDEVRRRRETAFDRFYAASGVFDHASRTQTPSQEVRAEETRDMVADLILELPEDERRVIELRHFEQLSFEAIAITFGRSANAVQLLHARAMTRFGRLLRRRGSGGGS